MVYTLSLKDTEKQRTFLKMHGLGNDFIILDCRKLPCLTPKEIAQAADRNRGVGCDQFIQLTQPTSLEADIFMHINNPDGSIAGACGNATRCVADLLMAEKNCDQVVIETISAFLPSRRVSHGRICVDMGAPKLEWTQIPLSYAADTTNLTKHEISHCPDLTPYFPATAINMGNPHCIFFVPDVEMLNLAALGAKVETHPFFPERTNVEFVSLLPSIKDQSVPQLRTRVWERGAGITQACGSGACAVAVAATRQGLISGPVEIILDGGALQIDWRQSDQHVLMTGPVSHAYQGQFSAQFFK